MIPGMRCLAELVCPDCDRRFYGDLPYGHGLYYPCLIDTETGTVECGTTSGEWFATWLGNSYRSRSSDSVAISVQEYSDVDQPIFLNCLDTLYGHSLLKLLNIHRYREAYPEHGLVVLIPSCFEWFVPEYVDVVLSVD